MSDYSALDEGLTLLQPFGPDLSNGFTNHAPMAIEALAALGRAGATGEFLARYRGQFLPRASASSPIDLRAWRDALGTRFADWSLFFSEELQRRAWRDVAAEWSARLIPAASCDAFHGIIRVGHAVRATSERTTEPRKAELADALGHWAATYAMLPEAPARRRPAHASEAIEHVPLVPLAERRPHGAITTALKVLDASEPFASVLGLLDVSGEPARTLSDLAEIFARVFLANARDALTTIVFVHAVTGPVALRSLLPLLTADEARRAVGYVWQGSAALYACYAVAPPEARIEPPRLTQAQLIDDAIATGDEHAIKFTEALLREYAVDPRPAYLAAASRGIEMFRAN